MYHKRDTSRDRTGRRSTALRNAEEDVGWKGNNGDEQNNNMIESADGTAHRT